MSSPAERPATATLLVTCPDQRGIVAALAQVLYGHGANILDADQHTDTGAGIFFQRIHFDQSELRMEKSLSKLRDLLLVAVFGDFMGDLGRLEHRQRIRSWASVRDTLTSGPQFA